MKKKISVCIPVFGSEKYLEECLKSVGNQSFKDFEVVVVNDCSTGFDFQGRDCKQIVKDCKKKYKIPVNYIEHKENKGLLEARRSGVYEAKGEFIFNLDSDDKLPIDALENLYNVAVETCADIIHGKADLFVDENIDDLGIDEKTLEKIRNDKLAKVSRIIPGIVEGKDIFNGYLVKKNHCGFMCGKLFSRELYLEAFDKIPPMFCTMSEDIIQYFWITYFAEKYAGVDKVVYHYCDNTGITSVKIIDNLEEWERVCSVASVFTTLINSINEERISLSEEEKKCVSGLCVHFVRSNLESLNFSVIPELRNDAFNVLCDFWGEGLVKMVAAGNK